MSCIDTLISLTRFPGEVLTIRTVHVRMKRTQACEVPELLKLLKTFGSDNSYKGKERRASLRGSTGSRRSDAHKERDLRDVQDARFPS